MNVPEVLRPYVGVDFIPYIEDPTIDNKLKAGDKKKKKGKEEDKKPKEEKGKKDEKKKDEQNDKKEKEIPVGTNNNTILYLIPLLVLVISLILYFYGINGFKPNNKKK